MFFDDFKVEHVKSAVVQMDDYYPFGLTFNSYQRENSTPQDFKYNGKEIQDELGLGWLDYGARMYQSDLGRFFNQDRFSEKYYGLTPYQYGANNPIMFVDINGDSLIVAGPGSAQAVGLMNQGLGGSYQASTDNNGLLTVSATGNGTPTAEQKNYFDQLSGATDLNEPVTKLSFVVNDATIPIADPPNGTVDIGDIQAIAGDPATAGLNLGPQMVLHEVAEQYVLQSGQEKTQEGAHSRGIATENSINPNIQRTQGTDVVRSIRGGTIFTQIQYIVSGAKNFLQVTLQGNNVSNVRLIK